MVINKVNADILVNKFQNNFNQEIIKRITDVFTFYKDNDWAFIIKLHALIELVISDLLNVSIGDGQLKKIIDRLPISDKQYGKVLIARDLNLIADEDKKYIYWLSELRNSLVHNIENLGFDIETTINNSDKKIKSNFIEMVSFDVNKEDKIKLNNDYKLNIASRTIRLIIKCLSVKHSLITKTESDSVCENDTNDLIQEQSKIIDELMTLLKRTATKSKRKSRPKAKTA